MNNVMIVHTLIASIIAFGVTYYFVKWWIKRAYELGIVGKDMNKKDKRKIPEAGGVWVSVAASFGILLYVAFNTYTFKHYPNIDELLALALMLFMASFLGFLDDILGWKKGLKPIYRVIMMAPLAIPLVVIKAGFSTMAIPFLGRVDFGLLYPLVLVPIGILGASNAFNMIAGYNGLEASQGILLLGFTALYCYMKGIGISISPAVIMIAALLGFLIFNWYPAKVFPGNTLTYGLGAYYASLIIIGNFEKFGILLFTLYFIEFLLFLRGLRHGIYKENFGRVDENGYLEPPYDRIYSLTHLAIIVQKKIRGYATEKGVVVVIMVLQIIVGIISFLLVNIV